MDDPTVPEGDSQDPGRNPSEGGETSIELLRRVRAGDRAAIDLVLARYLPRLRRWANGRLPDGVRGMVDTDDMIQETLIRACDRLPEFEPRGEGALQAYLRHALRNRITDEVRKAARRPPAAALPENERDLGPSPLEATLGRETVERYDAAMERLREEDREAIVLRVEMGYTYEELASALGKPTPDAARMAVGRALLRLAREMNPGPM